MKYAKAYDFLPHVGGGGRIQSFETVFCGFTSHLFLQLLVSQWWVLNYFPFY
jgi:hypothetical protein